MCKKVPAKTGSLNHVKRFIELHAFCLFFFHFGQVYQAKRLNLNVLKEPKASKYSRTSAPEIQHQDASTHRAESGIFLFLMKQAEYKFTSNTRQLFLNAYGRESNRYHW